MTKFCKKAPQVQLLQKIWLDQRGYPCDDLFTKVKAYKYVLIKRFVCTIEVIENVSHIL